MKVYDLSNQANAPKTLKLNLMPRYWNKVTTFKNIDQKKENQNHHLNTKSKYSSFKTQLIKLDPESFEFAFINNYFTD